MRRVTQHINANLEAPIRVEDMATLTRLSTSYFFRAFKRSFGKAPHAYFIALRIARARELLVKSDEKICAIAMTCGFADQAHFSRVSAAKWALLRASGGGSSVVYLSEIRLLAIPMPQISKINLIAVREAGPYATRADIRLDGKAAHYRATLCQCGASKNKPYCDGSHHEVGFAATGEPPTKKVDMLGSGMARLLSISKQMDRFRCAAMSR